MKTNLSGMFTSDTSMQSEGKWFLVGVDVKFKMRMFGGANATEVSKLNAQYLGPYQKLISKGLFDKDAEKALYIKIFIKACLVDWEGLKDEEGKEIPYSEKAAQDLFIDLPDLMDLCMDFTLDKEEYKVEMGKSL